MSKTARKAPGRARLLPSRRPAEAAPSRKKPGKKIGTGAIYDPQESLFTADEKHVEFSNLDKVLYPEAGFTKGQVIDYYLRIAPAMLPHLCGRPLTLKRYPNGVDGMFFYEKRCPAHRPKWVSTGKVWSEGNNDYINYCVVQDKSTLAWLGNLACLEMHTLLSKLPDTNSPTSMVFDLDPGPPADILDSIRVGLKMRDVLAKLGLKSFAKTSGSKGLHLWVPLNTPVTFERTKQFAHAMALMFEREHPKEALSVMKRDLRKGKVFIDWSQNDEHKTTACVYTMRARSQPTVSCPVTWEELEQTLQKRAPNRLTFKTDDVLKRVEEKGDLFAPILKLKQKLPD
jgi:bifunctional non-homologous end joining protein LigD